MLVAQSCLTVCNPVDCRSPGFSVHGILHTRILEWVAMPFSRGSYRPRDQTWIFHKASRFFTIWATMDQFSSVTQSCLTLQPHGVQHARLPCPSPTPGVYSNSCPLNRWYHSTISSSVTLFSSCLQSFTASGSFQMSQFFASGGQSTGVSASASVLPVNIQDWFPLGRTGWISLQSKELSRVFSNTTVQKHQFFGTQLSL